MLEQKCRRHYDPVKQAGLPIGVQVCIIILAMMMMFADIMVFLIDNDNDTMNE